MHPPSGTGNSWLLARGVVNFSREPLLQTQPRPPRTPARGVIGTICLVAGIIVAGDYSLWGLILVAAGLFAIFESLRIAGVLVRACGIKNKVLKSGLIHEISVTKRLSKLIKKNFQCLQDSDEQQRQIGSLMATFGWFRRAEGEQSLRTQETKELLLSKEMRPALRHWYQHFGNKMNPAAMEFREHLSELAGEKFDEQFLF